MNKIDEISINELMTEVMQSKLLLHRLIQYPKEVQSILSLPLTPYLSNICSGLDTFIQGSKKFDDIGGIKFRKLINNNRASVKLLSDKKSLSKINNLLKRIVTKNNEILRLGYNEDQQRFIGLFGQKDLSVFFFQEKPISNSFQVNVFLYDLLDKELDSINTLEEFQNVCGQGLLQFSSNLALYISQVSQPFEEKWSFDIKKVASTFETEDIFFENKDFFFMDEERRDIFNHDLEKGYQLHLFNALCQLNFINYLIPLLIDTSCELYTRMEIITYLSSITSLENLYKSNKLPEEKQKDTKELIDMKYSLFVAETKLRNNIFHYSIDGVSSKHFKEGDNILRTLIEQSTDLSLENFIGKINSEMRKSEQIISDIIK